jgi:hypothetical protein
MYRKYNFYDIFFPDLPGSLYSQEKNSVILNLPALFIGFIFAIYPACAGQILFTGGLIWQNVTDTVIRRRNLITMRIK